MKSKVGIIVLASVLFALCSYAQDRCTVSGRVLDYESKEPIRGVNVIIRGGKLGTMTDTAGYFRLELPNRERRTVVFSHIAYRKEIRIASFDTTREVRFRVYLVPGVINLQEVVIAGKKQVVLSKIAERKALYSFGGDEFEKLGEEDMDRALRYMLPEVVARPEVRQMFDGAGFTLYVDGEFKESVYLDQIDPFKIRRVMVWGYWGKDKNIDAFPIGLPLIRGKYVILVETRQE